MGAVNLPMLEGQASAMMSRNVHSRTLVLMQQLLDAAAGGRGAGAWYALRKQAKALTRLVSMYRAYVSDCYEFADALSA